MTTATAANDWLTASQAAKELGIQVWQLGRLVRSGKVPKPPRFLRYYAFHRSALPRLRQAARDAHYLPGEDSQS